MRVRSSMRVCGGATGLSQRLSNQGIVENGLFGVTRSRSGTTAAKRSSPEETSGPGFARWMDVTIRAVKRRGRAGCGNSAQAIVATWITAYGIPCGRSGHLGPSAAAGASWELRKAIHFRVEHHFAPQSSVSASSAAASPSQAH